MLPLAEPLLNRERLVRGIEDSGDIYCFDAVQWAAPTAASASAVSADSNSAAAKRCGALHANPLTLEPGLDSFAWPLSAAEFRRTVYRKRPFVVHSVGNRATELARDFFDWDVPRMVAHASRVVVWMRDMPPKHRNASSSSFGGQQQQHQQQPARMHYLDVSPEVAAVAYSAGHTLYFNPALDVQTRLVDAMCGDLGLGWSAKYGAVPDAHAAAAVARLVSKRTSASSSSASAREAAGAYPTSATGDSDAPATSNGSGGDVEIFAVRGLHSTPWHFDAQENFTIQVRGTKRWTLCVGAAVADPLTNLHPSSSNTAAFARDAAVLALTSGGSDAAAIPSSSLSNSSVGNGSGGDDDTRRFIVIELRPGSVMYLPAGVWHRVDADDGEEGSLSINVSVSGQRWGDVLLRRILPALWTLPLWRERAYTTGVGAGEISVCSTCTCYCHTIHGGSTAAAAASSCASCVALLGNADVSTDAFAPSPRAVLAALLQASIAMLQSLTPEDILPLALMHGSSDLPPPPPLQQQLSQSLPTSGRGVARWDSQVRAVHTAAAAYNSSSSAASGSTAPTTTDDASNATHAASTRPSVLHPITRPSVLLDVAPILVVNEGDLRSREEAAAHRTCMCICSLVLAHMRTGHPHAPSLLQSLQQCELTRNPASVLLELPAHFEVGGAQLHRALLSGVARRAGPILHRVSVASGMASSSSGSAMSEGEKPFDPDSASAIDFDARLLPAVRSLQCLQHTPASPQSASSIRFSDLMVLLGVADTRAAAGEPGVGCTAQPAADDAASNIVARGEAATAAASTSNNSDDAVTRELLARFVGVLLYFGYVRAAPVCCQRDGHTC